MSVEPRTAVRLTSDERGRLLADLDTMADMVKRVDWTLTVAAARSGTKYSAWTETRLRGIEERMDELWNKVNHSPVDVD